MAKYILVDSLNMFHRAKYVGGGKDLDMRIGMAMHVMFQSIKKAWRDFNGDHVVFCLEGRSWRKDYYAPYKANRQTIRDQRSPREIEDDELFFQAYNDMVEFFRDKTNCSVIRSPIAEADDLIATWVQMHPDDEHVIVSSDSDFVQLLSENTCIYNGVTEVTYYHDRILNGKGKQCAFTVEGSGKVKVGKPDDNFVAPDDWIEFALFLKCIRGDSSDNVFSAFPGARLKGSKNKTGIREAFEDRNNGGFAYNNFMLQRWTDHEDVEHRVRDAYQRNRTLIDLTQQPEEIKEECRKVITECINKDKVSNVGIHFMKFAGTHDLRRLTEEATDIAKILNASFR